MRIYNFQDHLATGKQTKNSILIGPALATSLFYDHTPNLLGNFDGCYIYKEVMDDLLDS